MNHGLLPRKRDKRDYSYFKTFHTDLVAMPALGSVIMSSVPDEFDLDVHLTMPDQNADGLYQACTAYAQADICTDEDGVVYEPKPLYDKTLELMGIKPTDSRYEKIPCDIRSSLKAVTQLYNRGGYFDVLDSKPFDAFDTIRLIMWTQQRTVSVGSPWPKEWEQPINGIIPSSFVNSAKDNWHNFKFCGVKKINGVLYLIAKSWQGRGYADKGLVYFPREVVNSALSIRGSFAYTLVPKPTPGDIRTVQKSLWEQIITVIRDFLNSLITKPIQPALPVPAIVEEIPLPPPITVPVPPTYLWDTKPNVLHSCRVIMDEYSLQWTEKATLCAIIEAESNFNTQARNENKDKNGKVWSVDVGLLQINDYYNIGPGKYFASVEEVLANPEKSVRFLVEAQQRGQLTLWSSFKSGTYKQFIHHYL